MGGYGSGACARAPIARIALRVALVACLAALPADADDTRKLRGIKQRLARGSTADQTRAINELVTLDTPRAIAALEQYLRKLVAQLDKSGKQLAKLENIYFKKLERWLVAHYSGDPGKFEREKALRREMRIAEGRYDRVARGVRSSHRRFVLAAEAFPRFQTYRTIAQIEKGATDEINPLLRQFYIGGLAHNSRTRSIPVLIKLTGSKDPRVRAMAIRALRHFARDDGVVAAVRPLLLDPAWPVRRGLYELLANAPLRLAAPVLVAAAERESGELLLTVFAYLRHVSATRIPDSAKACRAWFETNRESIESGTYEAPDQTMARKPLAGESRTVSTFFKIPIDSTRIVFVIDLSTSMKSALYLKNARANKLREKHNMPFERIAYAKAELILAINALPDGAHFNIVTYSDRARSFSTRMMPSRRNTRQRAAAWVGKLKAEGETNIYAALDMCFRRYFLSGGRRRFMELPDTIVFLTDGNATRGQFQQTRDLVSLVRIWNRPLDCVIHCVGIGNTQDRAFLRAISGLTGGFYVDLKAGAKSLAPRVRRPRLTAPTAPKQPGSKAREGE